MPEITPKQKRIAIIGGAVLILFLLYRHYAGQNAAAQTAATTSSAPGSDQFAALAGQEQSDAAALQAQEQSDFGSATAQEQSDVAALTGTEQQDTQALAAEQLGLAGTLAQAQNAFQTSLMGQVSTALGNEGSKIAALASGQQAMNRSILGTAKLTGKGAILAPYGTKKPPAKKGFTIKGLGGGFWEYLPIGQKTAAKNASKGGTANLKPVKGWGK